MQKKMLEYFDNSYKYRELMKEINTENDEKNRQEIERRDREIELYKKDRELKRLEIETIKEELRVQKIRENDLKASLRRDNEVYEDNMKKQVMKEQELIGKLNETQETMQTVTASHASLLAQQEATDNRYKKMLEKVA